MTATSARLADTAVGAARPDVLGDGYEAMTISLPDDSFGPAQATLVRHRASTPTTRAVLYVHGLTDYFFQTELAEFHSGRGADFYAIDLRRYGRSLLPGQIPYAMADVADYAPELEAAMGQIIADGHTAVTVVAHSTGGLIAAIWLADRAESSPIDTVVFNTPFLEINANPLVRSVVGKGVEWAARLWPQAILPLPDPELYGRSIHVSGGGEWDFNLEWKPLVASPVRLGWLAAIRRAQRRLEHNLGLPCPVLVVCSTSTFREKTWSDRIRTADAVLNADRIADMSTRLGRQVTCIRIPDAMHDIVLSRPDVRAFAYREIGRWLDNYESH